MGAKKEADPKNSLLGEFLVALVRAPEQVQEAILLHGIKKMRPWSQDLIEPYPMLSHMCAIMEKQSGSSSGSQE